MALLLVGSLNGRHVPGCREHLQLLLITNGVTKEVGVNCFVVKTRAGCIASMTWE